MPITPFCMWECKMSNAVNFSAANSMYRIYICRTNPNAFGEHMTVCDVLVMRRLCVTFNQQLQAQLAEWNVLTYQPFILQMYIQY